ncbi:MAG: hypothetical protein ACT4QD_04520 [Acidobacteriota bacterium]
MARIHALETSSTVNRALRRFGAEVRHAGWWLQAWPRNAAASLRNAIGRRRYVELDEAALLATRSAETVFVFGSGRSLLDITAAGWTEIASANTISFREFPRQTFVRADYHVTGEIDDLDAYARRIRENPRYAKTVFVVQKGWRASGGNELIGRGLLPRGARVFRYKRTARGRYVPPSRRFADGLVHGHGTVVGVVNFAVLMGWRRIVLAGVDLYDKRYFWLPVDEGRSYEKPGLTVESRFTGADDIVEMLGRWRVLLDEAGIDLRVLDSRSLLAGRLPVHQLAAAAPP